MLTEVTFNYLMNGFCKEGKINHGDQLFCKMLQMNLTPNVVTYNILLDGHCEKGDVQEALWLWYEMQRVSLKAKFK